MADEVFKPETYIQERVNQYQGWYDRKAVMCKSRFLRMRAFAVIAGVLVPVLTNLDYHVSIQSHTFNLTKIAVSVLSLLVAIFVSLESVLHYREQWKNYRSTEQLLGHEQWLYETRVGRYKKLPPEEAFSLFVERVEDAIASENSSTLNVMTVASEATSVTKGPEADEK